jgi:hypothetical protein
MIRREYLDYYFMQYILQTMTVGEWIYDFIEMLYRVKLAMKILAVDFLYVKVLIDFFPFDVMSKQYLQYFWICWSILSY